MIVAFCRDAARGRRGRRVGGYVADAVRVVRESGLPSRTDAMFTSIECGEWDEGHGRRPSVPSPRWRRGRLEVSLVLKADVRPVTDGAGLEGEDGGRHLRVEASAFRLRPPRSAGSRSCGAGGGFSRRSRP
ncbi:MTH1187 family thiamine-binding protein [Streptomyces sp. KL116D]|uniref:thiamine-binding protein n=1 Tax=Streptomyces sp. KL116D TaxID=3045152 RepID=UPI003557842B